MEHNNKFDFSYFDEVLSKGVKLAIFDVEGTLVNSRVTDYFLYIKKKKATSSFLHKIWKLRMGLTFGLYYLFLDQIDRSLFQRSFYTKLSSISLNDFLYYGKKYFDEYLNKRFIYYTHDLLFYLKNKGIKVILLSTAVDPVVQPLAEYFNVPYSCIGVSSDENNYIDMSHIKKFKIDYTSQYEAASMIVIADSKHDLDILKYAKFPVIVGGKRKKWMNQVKGKLIINNHIEEI